MFLNALMYERIVSVTQADPELEAIRQKRMAELNQSYGVSERTANNVGSASICLKRTCLHHQAALLHCFSSTLSCRSFLYTPQGQVPQTPEEQAAAEEKQRRVPHTVPFPLVLYNQLSSSILRVLYVVCAMSALLIVRRET